MNFLCFEILNSDRVDWRHTRNRDDMLDKEEWLRGLLGRWRLQAEFPVSRGRLTALKKLRASMRGVLSCHQSGMQACEDHIQHINSVLTDVQVRTGLIFAPQGFILQKTPSVDGWPLFIWTVACSFAEMLVHSDLSRVKTCANEDCGWVFFDQSKNRTRRWCDDKVCGNIMKVRRFRARRKLASTE